MNENKKVVMIIAKNIFRDEEYFEPKKVLTDSGIKVVTASSSKGEAIGKFGAKVTVDTVINDIDINQFDAIIFIGGVGCEEYFGNLTAHKLIKEALDKDKIVASICAAGATLANAGILKGKKATSFEGVKDILIKNGAKYTGTGVEVDGNIVTASGPQAATAFGQAILKLLKK